ncbi:MAG: hypothetical protein Q7J02_11415 [Rhodocyclaceae bacterium]|nr:hypothetical protein [Rhodocyclaceae bacterium]
MNVFPDIQYKQDDYRAELGRHLDDPIRKAICELLWHGTNQYQRIIARDGALFQQVILKDIRLGIRKLEGDIAALTESEGALLSSVESLKERAKALADTEEYRRDHNKRLILVDQSHRVAELLNKAGESRNKWIQSRSVINEKRRQLDLYRQVDERLTSALLVFMEEQAERDATSAAPPPAPVINVNVEPTPVTMEAQINMPPVQISGVAITAMPTR